MTAIHLINIIGLLLLANVVMAQQVFKSVDESGRVTYSPSPPQDAVKANPVEIEPGPSTEQVNAAQQRAEQMKQQARAIDRMRKPTEPGEADPSGSPEAVDSSDDGLGETGYNRRPVPLARVPIESPSEGDHPIYGTPEERSNRPVVTRPEPIDGPVTIQPVPRPRPGRR